MPVNETYTTQWESPSETGGRWSNVVANVGHGTAYTALNKLVDQRKHCRVVLHRPGQEDTTLDERGPFNGPIKAADR